MSGAGDDIYFHRFHELASIPNVRDLALCWGVTSEGRLFFFASAVAERSIAKGGDVQIDSGDCRDPLHALARLRGALVRTAGGES